MNITEFLLARIAEDEAAAREIEEDFECNPSEPLHSPLEVYAPGYDAYPLIIISRTRVLAECAAKRAIIDYWGPLEALEGPRLLSTMAAVYKDHPDYDPSWVI